MAKAHYMVIETYRGGAAAVYERFRERGRMAPDGLEYVSSWIDATLQRCYQVMATDDPRLLDEWVANWSDLIAFEIIPVITSAEAAARAKGPDNRESLDDR